MNTPAKLSSLIKRRSEELGFDLCGIARSRELTEYKDHLNLWLEEGLNAGMDYMERNFEKRIDPGHLVEGARSVIVVGLNYYQDEPDWKNRPRFSKYAFGKDYHLVLKDKLYRLFKFIKEVAPDTTGRVFVDSAPVLEKIWAVEAGLGWIGKNSMLISKNYGSFMFLGELIVDIDLEYDKPETGGFCGSCTKCIEACPNQAILTGKKVDSNRCISCLTIEHRGEFNDPVSQSLHEHVFGCDICQDVCPWNNRADVTDINEFDIKPEIRDFTREQWQKVTEEQYAKIFHDSPVQRTGYSGFLRNLRLSFPA